jgi:hypothetical protein
MAILDVAAAKITAIFPAGFKNHALAQNPLDPSDRDGGANIKSWPVFGKYQADEIKAFSDRGVDYIVAANEGDERDWPGATATWSGLTHRWCEYGLSPCVPQSTE